VIPTTQHPNSIAASRTLNADKVKSDRKAICAFIAKMGPAGATDDELSRALPQIHTNALRARRGECIDYGVITDICGERRPTATGCMATVHHVSALGLTRLGLSLAEWHADQVTA